MALSLHPKFTAFERLLSRPRDAVVSGRTAACMHGDTSFYEAPFAFDVPAPKRISRKDIELRLWPIGESDVVMIEGLPVPRVSLKIPPPTRFGKRMLERRCSKSGCSFPFSAHLNRNHAN